MVQAVASRVVPRARVSKAMAREAAEVAARRADVAAHADAPASVHFVPVDAADDVTTANAFIRPMGNSRRVFLLDPYMKSAEELDGLAHRIKVLSHNEGINSVLIATDDGDDVQGNCLPTYLQTHDEPNLNSLSVDLEPTPGHTWHVAGGYDPLAMAEETKDTAKLQQWMESISKLSAATKGLQYNTEKELASKIPIITMPHGAVTDGGYALCMGSYVLATPETCFQIANPSRGLSFDPVGFSYFLSRLGMDGKQRSMKFARSCGMILALTGYEANCYDMVETGLATHLVSGSQALPLLERRLAAIPPYSLQKLVEPPKQFYGQPPLPDANAKMRNVSVAYAIENISQYAADATNSVPLNYFGLRNDDPALDTDHVPWESAFFNSDLVDYAHTFDTIFREKSLQAIIEKLKEVAAVESNDVQDQECSAVAKDLVDRMESQSPLALRVIFQLIQQGSSRQATFDGCLKREQVAQVNMLQQDDFASWAKHCRKHGMDKASEFRGWKHENVAAVTADEVAAIIN